MIRTMTLAALAVALLNPAARAQVTTVPRNAPAGTAPAGTAGRTAVSDTLFAEAAASGGIAELMLSELGAQRATHPDLKAFSTRMIEAHTRMNGELTQLAAQKRMQLPRNADYRAQFCAQSLAGLTGEEFDRCYAKAQLVAHMDAVGAFEAEAERGQDPQVKALAAKALPHIKEHLKTIRPIAMKFEKDRPSTEGAAEHGKR